MVIRDRANCIELAQVVLERSIVALPGYYVEWRVMLLVSEELALELVHYSPLFVFVFIPSDRHLKVSPVG